MNYVTAIMPTRGRREYATHAVASFLAQTHARKQLVILDDAEDPSFPYGFVNESVKYVVLSGTRSSIPSKRQKACEIADGDVICHFDSDDWSASNRIAEQLELMRSTCTYVVGYNTMLFVDEAVKKAWRYHGDKDYALGTSLMYRSDWWHDNPWREDEKLPRDRRSGVLVASDNRFVERARKNGILRSVDSGMMMVARIHDDNSNRQRVDRQPYKPVDYILPEEFVQCAQAV